MLPILLTLPDTPVASARGLVHLFIVGIVLLVSLIGIIILAARSQPIPGVLEASTTLSIGYLIGANVVSNSKN